MFGLASSLSQLLCATRRLKIVLQSYRNCLFTVSIVACTFAAQFHAGLYVLSLWLPMLMYDPLLALSLSLSPSLSLSLAMAQLCSLSHVCAMFSRCCCCFLSLSLSFSVSLPPSLHNKICDSLELCATLTCTSLKWLLTLFRFRFLAAALHLLHGGRGRAAAAVAKAVAT